MLPEMAIVEWQNCAPWPERWQVEQDLIISRALVEIFQDEYLANSLAFRGGTALHKLFLAPPVRYSEDIDLVQISEGPVGPLFDKLRSALAFLGKPKTIQKQHGNKLLFRTESTLPPITRLRLKLEINSIECFSVFGYSKIPFEVSNAWFSGSCEITSYTIEELLGTKLRALYQRKKGRDLFDLWSALEANAINNEKIVRAYHRYIAFSDGKSPSAEKFIENLDLKMGDESFLNDITELLRPGFHYDPHCAYGIVRKQLLELI
jgi:predicted nucleotidyltransferase component of viral defense system